MHILRIILIYCFNCLGVQQNTNDELFERWRKDQYGCDSIRITIEQEIFEKLLLEINIKYSEELFVFLGRPENIMGKGNVKTYWYYRDGACDDDGNLIDSEYCFYAFQFRDDHLEGISFVCE